MEVNLSGTDLEIVSSKKGIKKLQPKRIFLKN